jgi:lysophospholipase L1-like esterase
MTKSFSRYPWPQLFTCLFLVPTVVGPWPICAQEDETTAGKWETEIRTFEAADKTNPPPKGAILFIGSSSILLWKTLAGDFSEHKVINRGFGGSQIIDSVNFAGRIVLPYRPRMVVLYAGGNDINSGKSPEQVFADFQAFVKKVHATLPETRIAYIPLRPTQRDGRRWKR